jgi:hypothetical protein
MSVRQLDWMCRACKEVRPDAWISVAKRRIVIDRRANISASLDPVDLTACYCNDRPLCFQAMPRILDTMARVVIDGLVTPRVHVLWNGFALCDSHKRFPEDFPIGTVWIDVTHAVKGGAFAEVTCDPCCKRLMLVCVAGTDALSR